MQLGSRGATAGSPGIEAWPKITDVRFETGNYLIRNLVKDDVSDGWGSWLSDPVTAHLLNAPCRVHSKRELQAYIEKFGTADRILLGIFHKPTQTHIGLLTIVASRTGRDALVNIIVGDGDFRSISGMLELKKIRTDVENHLFFSRGFRSIFASVAEHNARMIAYLRVAGWEVVGRTTSQPSPKGETVELVLFRLTSENYKRAEGASWTMRRSD